MFLDDRKKKILKAIIDDYINTAEPVGSRSIARRHELGLSPATIRIEMSDLEDLGFLAQPHTSSGRVPSDKGYRFYVDELMHVDELPFDQMQSIKKSLEQKMSEVEQLIKTAASLLSSTTHYTSMATAPLVNDITVKAISLVWLEDRKVLVVLVVNGNIIKNSMIKLERMITKDETNILTNVLNEKITGMPLSQVPLALNMDHCMEKEMNIELFREVTKGVYECMNQIELIDYFLDGTKNILNFPEFKDLEKAKLFLEMMDKKETISSMLKANQLNSDMLNIQIGQENEIIEARDCSVIITNYSLGDTMLGSIGIIGPTRMEYAKVIQYLNHIRKKINEEIQKLVTD
jgi:heat-inducible transcriptional repressor